MPNEETFLQEEERCGFTVSAQMKQVWAVQLDLLDRFQDVCRRHGLRYFASGGTLIGAVRHGGYIPWDDDLDIIMLREEYEKLLAIADTEFTAPYFLQTAWNDTNYSRGHAQLRNSNTTAILKEEDGFYRFNQGIFIDIFPADAVADDERARQRQYNRIRLWEKLLNVSVRYASNKHKSLPKSLLHAVCALIPYRFFIKQKEKACTRYNGQGMGQTGTISFIFDERMIYPTRVFKQVKTVPFEYTTIDIPADYDTLLTKQYGDYMTMKQENSYHGGIIFDAERSYLDYLK